MVRPVLAVVVAVALGEWSCLHSAEAQSRQEQLAKLRRYGDMLLEWQWEDGFIYEYRPGTDRYFGPLEKMVPPVMGLLRVYQFTGDRKYLDAAKKSLGWLRWFVGKRVQYVSTGKGPWRQFGVGADDCFLITGDMILPLYYYYQLTGDSAFVHQCYRDLFEGQRWAMERTKGVGYFYFFGNFFNYGNLCRLYRMACLEGDEAGARLLGDTICDWQRTLHDFMVTPAPGAWVGSPWIPDYFSDGQRLFMHRGTLPIKQRADSASQDNYFWQYWAAIHYLIAPQYFEFLDAVNRSYIHASQTWYYEHLRSIPDYWDYTKHRHSWYTDGLEMLSQTFHWTETVNQFNYFSAVPDATAYDVGNKAVCLPVGIHVYSPETYRRYYQEKLRPKASSNTLVITASGSSQFPKGILSECGVSADMYYIDADNIVGDAFKKAVTNGWLKQYKLIFIGGGTTASRLQAFWAPHLDRWIREGGVLAIFAPSKTSDYLPQSLSFRMTRGGDDWMWAGKLYFALRKSPLWTKPHDLTEGGKVHDREVIEGQMGSWFIEDQKGYQVVATADYGQVVAGRRIKTQRRTAMMARRYGRGFVLISAIDPTLAQARKPNWEKRDKLLLENVFASLFAKAATSPISPLTTTSLPSAAIPLLPHLTEARSEDGTSLLDFEYPKRGDATVVFRCRKGDKYSVDRKSGIADSEFLVLHSPKQVIEGNGSVRSTKQPSLTER